MRRDRSLDGKTSYRSSRRFPDHTENIKESLINQENVSRRDGTSAIGSIVSVLLDGRHHHRDAGENLHCGFRYRFHRYLASIQSMPFHMWLISEFFSFVLSGHSRRQREVQSKHVEHFACERCRVSRSVRGSVVRLRCLRERYDDSTSAHASILFTSRVLRVDRRCDRVESSLCSCEEHVWLCFSLVRWRPRSRLSSVGNIWPNAILREYLATTPDLRSDLFFLSQSVSTRWEEIESPLSIRNPSASPGGELILGALDGTKYSGSVIYADVVRRAYWEFLLDR